VRQAVVLAGGLGTRVASLSQGMPKVLLPVGRRPFLAHLIGWLEANGVSEVVLLLGHQAAAVSRAAHEAAGHLRITESVEQEPLGTGGALKLAEPGLDERFLMVNGDTFLDLDLESFERLHDVAVPDGVIATLALVRHREAGEKGAVKLSPDGQIVRFLEKGVSGPGLINAGVYAIEKEGLADIPPGRAVSLERETFPLWMARADGKGLQGVITDAYFVDIGLPNDYLGVKDGFPHGAR
jgi:NDP-sugar pyrophosphorylase family protein